MVSRIQFDPGYLFESGPNNGMYGVPIVGILYMTETEYALYQVNGITISVTGREP